MKRIAAVCLLFILIFTSCAERSEVREPSAEQLAAAVLASQDTLPPLYAVRYGEDGFEDYASLYLTDVSDVTDGVICYPYGVDATELAVLRFADADAAENAEESMTDYLLSRASAFEGYAPEQAAQVENGRVVRDGRTVLLAVFRDTDAAVAAFEACMDGAAPSGTLDSLLAASPSPSVECRPRLRCRPRQRRLPPNRPERFRPSRRYILPRRTTYMTTTRCSRRTGAGTPPRSLRRTPPSTSVSRKR